MSWSSKTASGLHCEFTTRRAWTAVLRKASAGLASSSTLTAWTTIMTLNLMVDFFLWQSLLRALAQLVATAYQVGGLGRVARQLDGSVVRDARLLITA
jgi:hypothetical protein